MEMKPHVLVLVDVGLCTNPPGPIGAHLALSAGSDGAPGGFIACLQPERAFVFPSERLAHRYAVALLASTGATWMPMPEFLPGAMHVPELEPGQRRCRGCGCTDAFACPGECHWAEPDLCSECAKPEMIEMWTVYTNPSDAPGLHVARRSVGGIPTQTFVQHRTLEGVRAQLPAGLACIPRRPEDPAIVVEVWL